MSSKDAKDPNIVMVGPTDNVDKSVAEPLPKLVQTMTELLNRRMKVEITDGRVMIGSFHCLDKQGNLLLANTTEHRTRQKGNASSVEKRNLGLVLVPIEHRVSAQLELSKKEAAVPGFLDPSRIMESSEPLLGESSDGIAAM
eukprot:CAMPEP_0196584302 /NCGR_PEP_ID=MMETSP1081-20130531/46580_1 /TAXON_ID=36882 /ORGANISM="Pyramimonas amylifera, Strain CCMP720" /LENGTH=141 /DNA_ID=CAMNT_0041905461 /DNA_START=31 /DNA_END=456 /DNA_ORIENTATION=-